LDLAKFLVEGKLSNFQVAMLSMYYIAADYPQRELPPAA
jgi:hypothetical protein